MAEFAICVNFFFFFWLTLCQQNIPLRALSEIREPAVGRRRREGECSLLLQAAEQRSGSVSVRLSVRGIEEDESVTYASLKVSPLQLLLKWGGEGEEEEEEKKKVRMDKVEEEGRMHKLPSLLPNSVFKIRFFLGGSFYVPKKKNSLSCCLLGLP